MRNRLRKQGDADASKLPGSQGHAGKQHCKTGQAPQHQYRDQ
jgi:hypothetical protein